jgi:hypothetical protein
MNKIIYIVAVVLLGAGSASAQNNAVAKTEKFESTMKEMLKEDTEPMFKLTVAPAAFKDESVVMLAQKIKVKFYGSGTSSSSMTYVHTRILLNDIAALEEFSEFSFDKPNSSNAIQINIIKKDGKVEPVNLDDAISEEKKMNLRYINFNFSEEKKKIALKNLEVGDILEYVGLFDKWQHNYQATYYFASGNCIVVSKIVYEIEKDKFFVAYKSINKAPLFEITKTKTAVTYTVLDTMRKKYDGELEDMMALSEPHFKMRVIPKSVVNAYDFDYQMGKPKTAVTEKDLKQVVWDQVKNLENSGSEYYLDFIEKYGYRQPDDEYIKTYFYYLRDRIYTASATFDDQPKSQGLGMMNKLIRAAQKRNIPFEILLFKDQTEGRFDDILFEDELYWGVVFNTKEGDVGFYSFHLYAHPDEMPSDYEGTTAYRFKIGSSMAKTTITRFEIPVQPTAHNIYLTKTDAVFLGSNDSLKLNQQIVKKGYYRNTSKFALNNRYDHFNRYLKQLKEEKVIQNDNLRYYFITNYAYIDYDKDFIDSEELRCREVFRQNQSDHLKRYFESAHQSEKYKVLQYNDYKILSDSRSPDSNWVEWNEELIIGDITHKVNDKMTVLEIGEIFSGMYQINSDKNREVRTKPFMIRFNRSYISDLTLKLPEGFKIKDLTMLNTTFENKTGKFTTVASMNGNVLHVVLTKSYKANTYKKEEWPEYIAFLDAAASFNQVKIVLEK